VNRLAGIIDRGTAFLIVFPVLTFGAVQPWSMAVTGIAAFLIAAAGFRLYPPGAAGRSLPPYLRRLLLLFLALVVLSLLPLPDSLLSMIAPGTAALYRSLDDGNAGAWRSLSMTPHETVSYLWLLLACAGVFRTIAVHAVDRERVSRILRTILLTGTALAVFAVVQKVTWNGKIYWIYSVAEFAQPVGTFINRNHGAAYLGMVAAIGAAVWLYEMVRFEQNTEAPAMSVRTRAYALLTSERLRRMSLGLVAALVCSGGLFLSLSRGAMLSFAGAAAFFLLIARGRRSLRRKARFIAFIGLLLFLLIVAAGWAVIADRLDTIRQEKVIRFDVWADAVGIVKESPVLGTGLGTFVRRYPRHQTTRGELTFEHAENLYVELLAETGFAGFLTAAGAAALFGIAMYRRWRERRNTYVVIMGAGIMTALVMPLLHSLTDFHLLVPAIAMLFSIMGGLLYATVVSVGRTERQADKPTSR
jgi:O-antigen ligase